ncbi:hypothetical protein V2G26_008311 [Clonostachys chloroleuca]
MLPTTFLVKWFSTTLLATGSHPSRQVTLGEYVTSVNGLHPLISDTLHPGIKGGCQSEPRKKVPNSVPQPCCCDKRLLLLDHFAPFFISPSEAKSLRQSNHVSHTPLPPSKHHSLAHSFTIYKLNE